jgi:hypothetical protein
MAISTEVIRKITIQGSTQGVTQATDELNKFAAAQANVAVVSDTTSKRALSAEAAYKRQTLAVDESARSQNQIEKATRIATAALQQGVITQDEHAKRLTLINQKYGEQSSQQRAASIVLQDWQSKLSAATSATGTYGAAFAALGPTALAVTAAFGAALLAVNAMSAGAHELAEKAQELRRFAEITGLTTAQVQALRSEASKFGVTSDEAQTAIQNFTARFNELRLGQGELLTQIRRVNPALAEQMQTTTNAADALTLFSQALAKTDDVFQRNALVRAAGGRGGISSAAFLSSINVDQITAAYINAGKGLDENLIKKIAQLDIDIKKTSAAAKQNIESIFAQPVLEGELQFVKNIKLLSDYAKNFSMSDDMRRLLSIVGGAGISAIPGVGALYNLTRVATSPIGAGRGAANDDFAQRFQPATDNPLKAFTPNSAAGGLTLEAQVEKMKTLVGILGPAATEQEKFNLKLKELELAAKNAGVSAGELGRAQHALNEEFKLAGLREMVATLGAAATPAEQLALKVGELDAKLRTGAISQETYNRAIADFKGEQRLTELRNAVAALGSAATATEQYQLRVAELEQQLARGQISQETFNRAVLAANPAFQFAKASFEGFSQSLAQGLLSNKSLVDSLHDSFNNLASMAANAGLKNLLEGNFAMAAVDAVVTIGAKIASGFTDDSQAKELQKAKKAWFDMTGELKSFEATAAGFDLSGPAAQIQNLRETYNKLNVAAFAAQDFAGMQKALTAFGGNVGQVVKQFEEAQSPLSDFAKQITTLTDQANQLAQTLIENGSALYLDVLAKLPDQVNAIRDKAKASLQAGINDAQGKGFINDLTNLFAQVQQFRSEQSITGIPTGLINDYFIAQAQKIIDDSNLVGQSFNDLLKIFPDLTGKVHESTSALQDQASAQAQLTSQLNAAAKSVVDYVNSLNVGPDSALSPQNRLNAAQATYNATLSLAQQGNVDALNRVTSDFENLRKAAQSFFGSSGGYQNVLSSGIAQLLSLPAVQTSSDPVVQALLNVQTAVQGTTGAVQADTAATTPRLDQVINNLAAAINNLSAVVARLDTNNSVATSSNGILSALQGLQATASQQLLILASQNTLTTIQGVKYISNGNVGTPINFTPTNSVLSALNKIAFNTFATAQNTAAMVVSFGGSGQEVVRGISTFATGGILGAGGLGIFGEHHPNGPFIMRTGSSPVSISPSMPSGFANDNADSRALRAELAAMRKELMLLTNVVDQGNRINSQGHADNVGAVKEQTRTIKSEGSLDRLKPKAAA